MRHLPIRAVLFTLAVLFALISTYARAAVMGEARVQVQTYYSNQESSAVAIPWLATQYQTPTIDLGYAPYAGFSSSAFAKAGVDLPVGILTAWTSAHGRTELPGTATARSDAWGNVRFEDELQVQSQTLAIGTPVEIHLYSLLNYRGVGGASGASSFSNQAYAEILAYRSPLVPGTGINPVYNTFPGWGEHDFGDMILTASVGDTVRVEFDLNIKSVARAGSKYDSNFRLIPGQADSIVSGVLAFGAEATAIGGGDLLGLGLAEGPDIVLLSSALGGGIFPGREALDPANIAAHLQPVPAPGTLLLLGSGVLGLLAFRRRR
jgi:hypothetical protein